MVVGRIITVVILMVKIILTITYAVLPKYQVLFKHLKYSINLFNPHITPMRQVSYYQYSCFNRCFQQYLFVISVVNNESQFSKKIFRIKKRGNTACPRSHRQKATDPAFKTRLSSPKVQPPNRCAVLTAPLLRKTFQKRNVGGSQAPARWQSELILEVRCFLQESPQTHIKTRSLLLQL